MARISLGPWRDVSGGLDAQSVCLPVVFRDPAKGDYQPISTLDWNPEISTTAGWGVQKLGDVKAPAQDIAGENRPASPGLGARECAVKPAVTPDGTFVVQQSEGTKSAGVFTRDGTLVRYLFHDLPLAKGTYGFLLPLRSELALPLAPVIMNYDSWKATSDGATGCSRPIMARAPMLMNPIGTGCGGRCLAPATA